MVKDVHGSVSHSQNNHIWKDKFTASDFYKDYQKHLADRRRMKEQGINDEMELSQLRLKQKKL